jgi:hypothetical protein
VNKTDLIEKMGSLSSARLEVVLDGIRLVIEPREL